MAIKLSIIIPCKNRRNTPQILDSLCNQKKDYPQTEIIVIENASTDDMSFLNNYDVVLLHSEEGVSNARNKGLDYCTGDYISFIDNDDMVFPNYLKVLYENIGEYDWYIFQRMRDNRYFYLENLDINDPLKTTWCLWGYCFKRKLWENVRFDPNKKVAEDLIIFDIIPNTKGKLIKEVLYRYWWYGNEDSLSHRHNRGEI